MKVKLLILADDLTGCSDCASFFSDLNLKVLIIPFFKYEKRNYKADVLIFNTQSRHLKGVEAYRRNLFILKNYRAEKIYKKFDSTLRGNLIPEIKSILKFFSTIRYLPFAIRFIPLCFSFPEQGRTTKDGIHYVDGKIITKTQFSKDPHFPVKEANIRKIFKSFKDKVVILDAEMRKELDELALRYKDYFVLGGASGWLKSLIPYWFKVKKKNLKLKIKDSPLIISGTKNEKTFKQIEYFRRRKNIGVWKINPENGRIKKEKEDPCLIYLERSPETRPHIAMKNLIKAIKSIIKKRKNLIICGGETSYNVLKILKIDRLNLKGSIEEGIAILSYKNYNFILKPGGFGKIDLILRCYNVLGE